MKRKSFTPYLYIIGIFVLLALTACERPVRRDGDSPEVPDVVEATDEPIVIPTAIPTEVPEPAQPAAPDAGGETETEPEAAQPVTEEPAAETTEDVAEEAAAESSDARETSHTVQAGETLGLIAERYGLTIEELAVANGITNIHSLDVGQVLSIPVPGTVDTSAPAPTESEEERKHVVVAGENLFRIGLAYGFTVEELAAYNDLADPTRIEVGQTILIPPSK